MKSIELFRKIGYKQRYNNSNCVIYDLKNENQNNLLPETILIRKYSKEVEFITSSIEEHTHLGDLSFRFDRELLDAINKKIEELNDK